MWPIIVALGAVLLLVGIIVHWVAPLGFLVVAWAIAGWVREDIREVQNAPAPTGRSDYWYAVAFFIVSETIIFGVLFTYYFWARGYSVAWPPAEIPETGLGLVAANTVVLLTSGWTAHVAQNAIVCGDVRRFRTLMLVTIALGALFLLGQGYEYATAGFSPETGTYGSAFFALTGVHGFHVLGGLVALGTVLTLTMQGRITKERASGVSGAILYWHFVDAVWVILFIVLYLRWI